MAVGRLPGPPKGRRNRVTQKGGIQQIKSKPDDHICVCVCVYENKYTYGGRKSLEGHMQTCWLQLSRGHVVGGF